MTATDRDQLRILSVCHYVVAVLCFLLGFFPFIHLAIGIAIVSGELGPQQPANRPGAAPPPPPEFLGWMFIGFASLAILCAWSMAAALIAAGRCLSRRRSRTFCLIVAGFSCLNQPFGLILGVFTFVVLSRPRVRRAFEPVRDERRDGEGEEFDRYHHE